jgi:hypothetical protein
LSLDIIAQLWAAGASFTGLGRKLGVSRSMVAGRIDRSSIGFPTTACGAQRRVAGGAFQRAASTCRTLSSLGRPTCRPGLVRLRVAASND